MSAPSTHEANGWNATRSDNHYWRQSWNSHEYRIAIVSALPKERIAVQATMDRDPPTTTIIQPNDTNIYTAGFIEGLPVLLVSLPTGRMAQNSATTTTAFLMRSFPHVTHLVMHGIAGGLPDLNRTKDIRLGDVVFLDSPNGVYQYDLGRHLQSGKFEMILHPFAPSPLFVGAASQLLADESLINNSGKPSLRQRVAAVANEIVKRLVDPDDQDLYRRPEADTDILYPDDYQHSEVDEQKSCAEVPCDQGRRVQRRDRGELRNLPRVFSGGMASGNGVIKDSALRKELRKKDVLCVEMETAGLQAAAAALHKPFFGVRGICDYSDSHKNKLWQEYAAATAAAFVRILIQSIKHANTEAVVPAPNMRHPDLQQHFDRSTPFTSIMNASNANESLMQSYGKDSNSYNSSHSSHYVEPRFRPRQLNLKNTGYDGMFKAYVDVQGQGVANDYARMAGPNNKYPNDVWLSVAIAGHTDEHTEPNEFILSHDGKTVIPGPNFMNLFTRHPNLREFFHPSYFKDSSSAAASDGPFQVTSTNSSTVYQAGQVNIVNHHLANPSPASA